MSGFSDYRAQSAVRGASRAVDRRGLQTSRIRGERAIFIHQLRRRVRSASLVYLERPSSRSSTGSSRTGPLVGSTRSAVDAVSMRARHGPPTHELGAQHDGVSQARAACFDSTVGLDARIPAKCQELLVAAEKASQSALSSLSRAATFPSLLNAAIATYC